MIRLAILLVLVSSIANAQPLSVQVSLEYYLDRLAQTDLAAAQLTHERNQLKQKLEQAELQIKLLKEEIASKIKK